MTSTIRISIFFCIFLFAFSAKGQDMLGKSKEDVYAAYRGTEGNISIKEYMNEVVVFQQMSPDSASDILKYIYYINGNGIVEKSFVCFPYNEYWGGKILDWFRDQDATAGESLFMYPLGEHKEIPSDRYMIRHDVEVQLISMSSPPTEIVLRFRKIKTLAMLGANER